MIRLVYTAVASLALVGSGLFASSASAGSQDLRPGDTATTPTATVQVTTVGGDPYVKLCATSSMVVSTFTWNSDVGKATGGTYPQRATQLPAGSCVKGTLTFSGTPNTVTYDPDNSAPVTWRMS